MRAVVILAALAGCFNPTTNRRCQYQCAASGTPCPSGLSCVNGMCVAPGDVCEGTADGGDGSDAIIGVCGDGVHDPGEVCYGAPIEIALGVAPYDANLADIDGDADLDLVYLTADRFAFHAYASGMFALSSTDGPFVFATHLRALDLDGDMHAELYAGGAAIERFAYNPLNLAYERTGGVTLSVGSSVLAMTFGKVHGTLPNVIAVTSTDTIHVLDEDALGGLTEWHTAGSIGSVRGVAAAEVDGNTFEDVFTAQSAGVMLRRGATNGLVPEVSLGVTGQANGVALGDIDNDGDPDVVFTQQAAGTLGIARAGTAATFDPPVTQTISGIGSLIETAKIDRDNNADVIFARTGPNAIAVALGRSDGTLAPPVDLPISIPPTYVRANADFNGDSIVDIVVTDPTAKTVVIIPSTY